MTRARRQVHRRRRGYVLLVALGLLVLSATLLVSIGRAAVDHALRARRAEAELQQRWSVVSARVAVLAGADETLTRLEQEFHRPLPVYRTTVRLGDETLELILSDEQAKANVNALVASAGKGDAETRVRVAIGGSGLTNAVMVRPSMLPPDRAGGLPRLVDGFGQIFDGVGAHQLTDLGETSPLNVLTCWGDGAVNVMRASRSSLALAAGGELNEVAIGRLIKARDAAYAPPEQARLSVTPRVADDQPISRSGDAVSSLLSRARIDATARGRVAMTSRSTCHSLWVIATSPTGRRQHSLFVLDESVGGERQVRSFAW